MKILVLNHFEITPPNFGGAERPYHLYKELSRRGNEVEMVDFQPLFDDFPELNEKQEVKHITENFVENTIREDLSTFFYKIFSEKILEKTDLVKIGDLKSRSAKKEIERKMQDADIVVLHHPYLFRPWMKKYDFIYDSANFELGLARDLGLRQNYISKLEGKEKSISEAAETVLAVSEEDKKSFITEYDLDKEKVKVVPNGLTEIVDSEYEPNEREFGFFIGSSHPPNVEAAENILQIANKVPNQKFVIAGSVCQEIEETSSNIELRGFVSEQTKEELYKNAKFGINPMESGRGSNIKVLEYMKHKLPVISTSKGLRGIEGLNSVGLNNMAAEIRSLSSEDLKGMSEMSKTSAEAYRWSEIADKYSQEVLAK